MAYGDGVVTIITGADTSRVAPALPTSEPA